MSVVVGLGAIGKYSDRDLLHLVQWITSDERLRTNGEILREAIEVLGFQRHTSESRERLLCAIDMASNSEYAQLRQIPSSFTFVL